MEFWGVEVKAGVPLKVQPEMGKLIHISQAALGEVKDVKAAKYVPLKLKIDNKNFIIGALSAEDRPQLMFDLVFEKEFEISHDWKNGSVFFIGYAADEPVSDDEGFSDFDDVSEDEAEPVDIPANGKPKAENVKAAKAPVPAKAAAINNDAEEDDDSESDSDDEIPSGEDSDDSDESLSGEEEEETPKAQQQSKKRPAEPAQKTPVQAKKAKADDSGNKKGHDATPFPNKGGNKSNGQGPKSGGFNKGQSPKSGGFNKGQSPKSGGFNKGQSGGFNKQSPKSGGFNKGQSGGFNKQSPKSGGFKGKRGGKN